MLRANHQLVKFTQDGCQNLFCIICDNPTKVDATGHHDNVISKALSFQSLAPATCNSSSNFEAFSPLKPSTDELITFRQGEGPKRGLMDWMDLS